MTWLEAVPVALLSAAWLLVPGLAVTYAAGLRGIAAWGLAPVVAVAVAGVGAVGAELAGVPWSPLVPLALAAVIALPLALVPAVRRGRMAPGPRSVTLTALAGVAAAVALSVPVIVIGFGPPGSLSQTYDAVFHYSAVAHIVDSGRGSTLTLAALGGDGPGFYPAAWHDMVALVVAQTGATVPAAANMFAAVMAAMVWPLSCLVLARQVFGPSRIALGSAAVLSVGFLSFPWNLLSFGVLWPNTLGVALIPAALGLVLSAVGLARDDVVGRVRAWPLLAVAAAAMGLANPGAFISFAVLAVFPAGAALLGRALRLHRDGRTVRGAVEVVLALGVAIGAWQWSAHTEHPIFAATRAMYWPVSGTQAHAVGEVLLNATNGRAPLWLLSALVLVGVVAVARTRGRRWLIGAHVMTAFLYVVAMSMDRPDNQVFTGYWYNDANRLAAMLPVTGVVLGTAAVVWLGRWYAGRVAGRERPGPRLRTPAAGAAAALVVLLAATGGLYIADRGARIYGHYRTDRGDLLADDSQRLFFERLREVIPEDAVVANDPFDGSGLIWGLAGRRTLYPHFSVKFDEAMRYLAQHLTDAASDPKVCRYLRERGVEYLLVGEEEYRPTDPRHDAFPGLADPQNAPGFTLVAADGDAALYRITACG